MNDVCPQPSRPSRMRLYGLTGFAVALGLLFWARLIVVSDLPRTAIADEEERRTEPREPRDHAARAEADTIADFEREREKSPVQVAEDSE